MPMAAATTGMRNEIGEQVVLDPIGTHVGCHLERARAVCRFPKITARTPPAGSHARFGASALDSRQSARSSDPGFRFCSSSTLSLQTRRRRGNSYCLGETLAVGGIAVCRESTDNVPIF